MRRTKTPPEDLEAAKTLAGLEGGPLQHQDHPAFKLLLKTRKPKSVYQLVRKVRVKLASNGTPERKPSTRKAAQDTGPAFCPNCGCNMRAIAMALRMTKNL